MARMSMFDTVILSLAGLDLQGRDVVQLCARATGGMDVEDAHA